MNEPGIGTNPFLLEKWKMEQMYAQTSGNNNPHQFQIFYPQIQMITAFTFYHSIWNAMR